MVQYYKLDFDKKLVEETVYFDMCDWLLFAKGFVACIFNNSSYDKYRDLLLAGFIEVVTASAPSKAAILKRRRAKSSHDV